jgi:pseudouridine-5'-phosphate glycosidase
MSSWIKKNIVSVTTGDSLWTSIDLVDSNGN